jgi:hypothetical protein
MVVNLGCWLGKGRFREAILAGFGSRALGYGILSTGGLFNLGAGESAGAGFL